MPLGENIKKARLLKGMNQKELAEALKEKDVLVGNTSISNWENNIKKPIMKLITYYSVRQKIYQMKIKLPL